MKDKMKMSNIVELKLKKEMIRVTTEEFLTEDFFRTT